jgi:hypothetical protein
MQKENNTFCDLLASYDNGKFADEAKLVRLTHTMIADAPIEEANSFDYQLENVIVGNNRSGQLETTIVRFPIATVELNSQEDEGIQDLAIKMDRTFFYGYEGVYDKLGLADICNASQDRFNSQVIDAGGVEEDGLTSIYLIRWNRSGVFLTYPRDSRTFGYTPRQLRLGIVVKNPRHIVRIANVPINEKLDKLDIEENLFKASLKISNWNSSLYIYANEIVRRRLFAEVENPKRNVSCLSIGPDTNYGYQLKFWNNPIKLNEQISNSEPHVKCVKF